MSISKMWQGQALHWTMNFLKSTEVKEVAGQEVIVAKDDRMYDLASEVTMLRYYLQDEEISHIPPEGRLAHEHYRNPIVFKEEVKEGDLYVILEKTTVQDNYVEYYLRIQSGYIYVGFEAEVNDESFGKKKGERVSHDRPFYGLGNDSKKLLKLGGDYIINYVPQEVAEKAKELYEHKTAAQEKLIKELFKNT